MGKIKKIIQVKDGKLYDFIVDTAISTNKVAGKSKLSDAIDSELNASDGGTAATPLAVKLVNDRLVKLENEKADEESLISAPTIISPTNESVDVSVVTTLEASPYQSVIADNPRTLRNFQVTTVDDIDFKTPIINEFENSDSITIPTTLNEFTEYLWRCKDRSTLGMTSAWSEVAKFTTGEGIYVLPPSNITISGQPSDILGNPTITCDPFSVSGGGNDTHEVTDWVITNVSEDVVWESLNDGSNKTTITLPNNTLQPNTEYNLKVRFKGVVLGWSQYSNIKFTTANDFGTVNPPTLNVEGAPNDVYNTPQLTGGAFSNTRDPDTHEMTDWEIIPASGGDAIWQSLNDTSNLTSIRVPDAILQVSTAYKARCRYKGTNYGWSAWSEVSFTTVDVFGKVATPTLTFSQNDTEVTNLVEVTASAFSMEVGDGSHDKTDWILYKKSAPDVEAWSSKDDTVNLTTAPQGFKDALEVSTEYTLKVRYHDSNFDIWSDYGSKDFTTKDTFAYIEKPSVVAPIEGSAVGKLSTLTIVCSDFSVFNGSDTHTTTDYKICSDTFGNDIVLQKVGGAPTSDSFTSSELSNLTTDGTYYIFVRFNGTTLAPSEWSDGVSIIAKDAELSEGGRLLYRHSSEKGTVIEFNQFDTPIKLFVPDAQYRDLETSYKTGKGGSTATSSMNIYFYLHNETEFPATQAFDWYLNDTTLAEMFLAKDRGCKTKMGSAKTNTDKFITRFGRNAEAANYCRSVDLGLGAMDLPTWYELAVIYLESDNLDLLDPTAEAYPNNKLGYTNPNGRFNFTSKKYITTCNEGGTYSTSGVKGDGLMHGNNKDSGTALALPILEL